MTVTQTRTPRGRTTPAPTSASASPTTPGTAQEPGNPLLDLNLPFLRVQVRPPDMHLPHVELPHLSRRDMGHAVDIARTFLPPPERIMYYGGLGALAAFGLLEWPVAAAIGAGTMIAQRTRSRDQRWSPLSRPAGQKGEEAGAGTRAGRAGAKSPAEGMAEAARGGRAGQKAETGAAKPSATSARSTAGRARAGAK
jgi:hypothetical protein